MRVSSILVLLLVVAPLFAAFTQTCLASAPVILGLANSHPLSQPQVGQLLLRELKCASCHGGAKTLSEHERAAPDLAEVGTRVAPEFLKSFIASPSATHSGSTMPDLFASQSPERRAEIADALTHFLVSLAPRPFQRQAPQADEVAIGRELFHKIGCLACHAPRDEANRETKAEGVVELSHLSQKYGLQSLADFLFQPTRIRPAGRMPDMKLTPAEAKAIASFLLAGANEIAAPFQTDSARVALGKQFFAQFNCTACHKLADLPAAAGAPPIAGLNLARGCLEKTPSRAPHFHLSEEQTQALQAALKQNPSPAANDKATVALTLTAFNCLACHVRDEVGGPQPEKNPFFQTSEKNLGDDGRIPPPLTLVGAKLQSVWLKKVLFDGESVRPYMFTRMPQFGEHNLRHLPDILSTIDVLQPVSLPIPNPERGSEKERQRERELRTAGRELLGDKGLSCVACHNFNGKLSPNNKGIDLMTSFQRLKPSWFYHFLRDPNALRPRILMPVSWPEGKAVQTKILAGDTDAQIQAIWYYLSLGTSAADPSGIHAHETKLGIKDVPRLYRGRSHVAGYRGIAVGFPGGLNYAFNAETGALTALWRSERDEFIRVDRGGQGAGTFNPMGQVLALPQDVAFCELENEQAAWPLRPVTTKDERVNPNPLYPKNLGYQFRGYFFDAQSVPTLMYSCGETEIQDRTVTEKIADKVVLQRTVQFSATKERTLWFRALVGKIEAESKQQFKVEKLRLTIPSSAATLRTFAADKNTSELIIPFKLPAGKSNATFSYEILP